MKKLKNKQFLNNKQGQWMPQQGGGIAGRIEDWVNNNAIWFIVAVILLIVGVLFSIQYATCHMGIGNQCLQVTCFGNFGIGCG